MRTSSRRKSGGGDEAAATKKWEKQYSQLKSYYKKQGHSKVPSSLQNELSEWVKEQRTERNREGLSQERIAKLDQLEFWWGNSNSNNNNNNGANNNNNNKKDPKKKKQGNNKNKKSNSKVAAAAAAAATTATTENDNFDDLYEQLQAFYKKKGHTRAPLTSNLGVWCQKMRIALRNNTISQEHREALEEIGFDYELPKNHNNNSGDNNSSNNSNSNNKKGSDDDNFDNNCDQLAAFYQEQGHFVIPKRHDLYSWVVSQRRAYREGRMKKQRKEKLEGIFFIWTESAAIDSQKTWDKNFDQLKKFKKRTGHSFVQRDDDIQLWRWTEKNDWKQRRGTLPRKRYERLASIGFWDPPPENLSERGEVTNQDEADTAFVMGGGSSVDGDAEEEESDDDDDDDDDVEEEEEEGNCDTDSSGDDDSDDDDDDDDDIESKAKSKSKGNAKVSHGGGGGDSQKKNKKRKKQSSGDDESDNDDDNNDSSKPPARKKKKKRQLRRCSTFDEDGFTTLYQVGTKVMKFFDEHGWFQGEIISIYEQNVYKVRYDDDDEETYLIPNEQKELEKIVANTDLLRYEVGTSVKKHFDGYGWFEGKVIAREEDRYKIKYKDGDKEEYLFHELEELDEIVANARSQ